MQWNFSIVTVFVQKIYGYYREVHLYMYRDIWCLIFFGLRMVNPSIKLNKEPSITQNFIGQKCLINQIIGPKQAQNETKQKKTNWINKVEPSIMKVNRSLNCVGWVTEGTRSVLRLSFWHRFQVKIKCTTTLSHKSSMEKAQRAWIDFI